MLWEPGLEVDPLESSSSHLESSSFRKLLYASIALSREAVPRSGKVESSGVKTVKIIGFCKFPLRSVCGYL